MKENLLSAIPKGLIWVLSFVMTLTCTISCKSDLDMHKGHHTQDDGNGIKCIELMDSIGQFIHKEKQINISIKNRETKEIILNRAFVRRIGNLIDIELETPIKSGEYILLKYSLDDDAQGTKADGEVVEYGLGIKIKVTSTGTTITPQSFNQWKVFGLGGSGTFTDPYLVTCSSDLDAIKKSMNGRGLTKKYESTNGVYFSQQSDIYIETKPEDWEPIGANNNYPFQGIYDGNGYTLSNLKYNKKPTYAMGFIGYAENASILNVKINTPKIVSEGYSGALVGIVETRGDIRMKTEISHCHILGGSNGYVKSSVAGGGLVGAVDQYAVLVMEDCSNSVPITGAIGQGGMVGMGVHKSSIYVGSCDNLATASIQLHPDELNMGFGGIIGTADTVSLSTCTNSATITANSSTRGVGGIVGGAGQLMGAFLTNKNSATIIGGNGVGGIIGSQLVNGSSTEEDKSIFNNAILLGCVNEGKVEGVSAVGGIQGEGQLNTESCMNKGSVTAKTGRAAGIIAHSPTLIAYNCANMGTVNGVTEAAGIVANSPMSYITSSINTGQITANGKNNYIGGIIAMGGTNCALHLSLNYGKLVAVDSKAVGGIAASIGEEKEYSAYDIATLVLSSVSLVYNMTGFGIGQKISDPKSPLRLGFAIEGVVENTFWLSTVAYSWSMYGGTKQSIISNCDSIASKFKKDRIKAVTAINNEIENTVKGQFNDNVGITSNESRGYVSNSMVHNPQWFEKINDNAVEDMNTRRAKAIETKKNQDLIINIFSSILVAVSLVAAIIAVPVTGGTSAASIVAFAFGSACTVTGMVGTVRNFKDNVAIVQQCSNHGTIDLSSAKEAVSGGIVGRLNDWGKVENCINIGSITNPNSGSGSLCGYVGDKTSLLASTNYSTEYDSVYGTTLGNTDPVTTLGKFRTISARKDGSGSHESSHYSMIYIDQSYLYGNSYYKSYLTSPIWNTENTSYPTFKQNSAYNY